LPRVYRKEKGFAFETDNGATFEVDKLEHLAEIREAMDEARKGTMARRIETVSTVQSKSVDDMDSGMTEEYT